MRASLRVILVSCCGACSVDAVVAADGTTGADPSTTTGGSSTGTETGSPDTSTSVADESTGGGPLYDVGPVATTGPDIDEHGIPTTCDEAEAAETAIGCVFHAVDLDNLEAHDWRPYAIVVANVQQSEVVSVTVEQKKGGVWTTVAGPQEIAELDLFAFEDLVGENGEGSGVREAAAFRVTSDRPVAVYQFNFFSDLGHSSDASLLYPTSSLDTLAFMPGWGQGGAGRAYVAIVGTVDGTEVELTSPVTIDEGPGVPGGLPNETIQIALDEGDVAHVEVATHDAALAGTRIESNAGHPIGVFTAHECAIVAPGGSCDHLEEQLSGVRTWGEDFVAARMPVRASELPEVSRWQIVASEDDTAVTFEAAPDVMGLPAAPIVLSAGEVLGLEVSGTAADPGDCVVHADRPIALVNYLVGLPNGEGGPAKPVQLPVGDPAVLQVPPSEQLLDRHVVLVPTGWDEDLLTITRPARLAIELDGFAIDDAEFHAVADGAYEVARISVDDGVHVLRASAGFGVFVVGLRSHDSYAYPAGAGTAKINPVPEG